MDDTQTATINAFDAYGNPNNFHTPIDVVLKTTIDGVILSPRTVTVSSGQGSVIISTQETATMTLTLTSAAPGGPYNLSTTAQIVWTSGTGCTLSSSRTARSFVEVVRGPAHTHLASVALNRQAQRGHHCRAYKCKSRGCRATHGDLI